MSEIIKEYVKPIIVGSVSIALGGITLGVVTGTIGVNIGKAVMIFCFVIAGIGIGWALWLFIVQWLKHFKARLLAETTAQLKNRIEALEKQSQIHKDCILTLDKGLDFEYVGAGLSSKTDGNSTLPKCSELLSEMG